MPSHSTTPDWSPTAQVNIKNLLDDAQCYQTVRELRWPEGITCPSCASQHVIKRGFDDTEPARQRYECHDCDQRFDALTDTIFADYFATHPGTPHTIRIRGGQEVIAIVGSARLYVSSHKTKRCVVALKYEGEDTYRSLSASDRSWRTLDIVQGHSLRWLVEIFQPHYGSRENLSLAAA